MKKSKKIKNFLANRIFFIVFILIVLPLIAYTYFLYKVEYKEKQEQVKSYLAVILSEEKQDVEGVILQKQNILNDIAGNLQKDKAFYQIAIEKNLQGVFYFALEGDNLICQKSSHKNFLEKKYNNLLPLLNTKYVLFNSEIIDSQKISYLSQTIYENNKSVGVLVIAFLKEELLDHINKAQYPFELAVVLVNSSNQVLASTRYNEIKKEDIKVKKALYGNEYFLIIAVHPKSIQGFHLKDFLLKHTLFVFVIFLFLFLISIKVVSVLAKPIKSLMVVMEEIGKGNTKQRYKKHVFGFEINYLGSFFNKMIEDLLSRQKQLDEEKFAKNQYIEQLKIAKDIQKSLLPNERAKTKEVEIAFGSIFAKEVGGDFYDFYEKDNKIFFVIVDISGKGLSACLYALDLRSVIRSLVSVYDKLEDIIINTNNIFLEDAQKQSMFATAFFGVYDIKTKVLQYSNAGHIPAILKKNNSVITELTTNGMAMGVEKFSKVQINQITLSENDIFFLYTDGILDAINKQNKFFGKQNLIKELKSLEQKNPQEIIDNIFKTLKKHSESVEQYDDISAFILKSI